MRASIWRSASTSASAQIRSIVVVVGRIVRVRRQAPTNLRAKSSFDRASGVSSRSQAVAELTRRAAREGAESVQPAQLGKMLVPGLGPHRVVGQFVPVHVELATDEIHDRRRNELARSVPAGRRVRRRRGEFERELIRERTLAGLKAARARGRKGGRKFALSKARVRLAQAAMAHRDTSVAELCSELGIRPVTLYRYVGPQGQLREALAGDVGTRQPTAREGQVGPVRVAERSVGYRGSRVMPAEGRDLRWKRWRNAAGSREWPTA